MAKRDPRTDPRPGDVLEDSFGDTVVVLRVSPDYVSYIDIGSAHREFETVPVSAWLDCHGTPEPSKVLHVAE